MASFGGPFLLLMLIIATNPAPYLSLVIGICGLAGLVFTALRYRRDDTTALVGQQDTILNEMRTLNDELRITTSALREERDSLKVQVEDLTVEIRKLREEMERGRLGA